ncbi:MAG: secretion system protein, partial [Firmicutes bacterium]|nr:secretion system protein [Bacillota bacterium]
QLSEGLTVMANSLRAGFSFMQAVDTLSKEMPPPLSTEFARLLKEMNLGTTTESALDNLMRRVDSKDLDLVVTSVKIQRQVGGNLAEIIDNIAKTIQQRNKLQGHLKTLTAQGRISGLIIGLLPIFIILFVSLLNPSYLTTLVTNPAGLFMLAYALVSEIIGFLIIKKIVTIDF